MLIYGIIFCRFRLVSGDRRRSRLRSVLKFRSRFRFISRLKSRLLINEGGDVKVGSRFRSFFFDYE